MSEVVPLRLGVLTAEGTRVARSGFRWLCSNGGSFREGDAIGYCNLSIAGPIHGLGDFFSFHGDRSDFQLALVARVDGRLHHHQGSASGGWLDRLGSFAWDPHDIVAGIEPALPVGPGEALVAHLFMAGRRACELAEDRSGLFTGWHDRSRAWRERDCDRWGTILGLGICELSPVVRGEDGTFRELLNHARGSAQVVDVPDSPLVHSARVIIERLRRSPEDSAALAKALSRAIADNLEGIHPPDWSFIAITLAALQRSPVTERYDLLTSKGVTTVGPADAVILSVNAEAPARLVHRQLGFSFDCHPFRFGRISRALRGWFEKNFAWVPRSIDDSRRDYLEMTQLLRRVHPQRQILVLNAMTTLRGEDILSYEGFDAPLGNALRGVRAREINGMLEDIAQEADLAIVDVDAIGAELGGAKSIPDGTHQNGAMQAELRSEIVSILRSRGVPGFA